MPVISVRIPQLGEGLQEALLVEFLKSPGDLVERDEPIYVMETDKATTDVESPYAGKLIEWTVDSGSVLEIGTEIAKMEVAEGVKEMPVGHGPESSAAPAATIAAAATKKATAPASGTRVMIPPKTRKYLKDHKLLDQVDTTDRRHSGDVVQLLDREQQGPGVAVDDQGRAVVPGEVQRGGKPSGAAADHDRVVGLGHVTRIPSPGADGCTVTR